MPYACTVCGAPEKQCQCPRFCMLCYSDYNVRLCGDGCYYCSDCREICGFIAEEKVPE